jgi:hypothetical protein
LGGSCRFELRDRLSLLGNTIKAKPFEHLTCHAACRCRMCDVHAPYNNMPRHQEHARRETDQCHLGTRHVRSPAPVSSIEDALTRRLARASWRSRQISAATTASRTSGSSRSSRYGAYPAAESADATLCAMLVVRRSHRGFVTHGEKRGSRCRVSRRRWLPLVPQLLLLQVLLPWALLLQAPQLLLLLLLLLVQVPWEQDVWAQGYVSCAPVLPALLLPPAWRQGRPHRRWQRRQRSRGWQRQAQELQARR